MTTSVALSPVAILQFFDNTGKPAIGGSLQTQVGGINYPTYSEPTGTTALPNPIPLNSRGEVSTAAGASSELFLQTGVAYTFILKDANGNQLWSVGNITSGGGNVAVSFPTASGTGNAQIVTNAVPISLGLGTIQWFLPVAANTGATTINVDNSGAKNAFFLTKALVGGELQVGVPAQIIYDGTQWNLTVSAKGPAADYYISTGTNNMTITASYAQLAKIPGGGSALLNGLRLKFLVANTNTSTAALNIDGGIGGSVNVVLYYSDGVTFLAAGSLIAGNIYDVIYDNTLASNGGFICTNPSRVTGSFTATLATGLTTTPTGTLNYAILPTGKDWACWAAAAFSGTSNASGMTITGVPAVLTNTTDKEVYAIMTNGGGTAQGGIRTGTSTTWTALVVSSGAIGPNNFGTSGTKGIPQRFYFTSSTD